MTHEEKLRVDRLAVEQRRTLRALTRDALREYCNKHEHKGNGSQAIKRKAASSPYTPDGPEGSKQRA